MCWLRIFSWWYGAIVILRNFLYNKKFKKSYRYSRPKVLAVGNLSLGGTGKTPLVSYLIQLLAKHKVVAVLSRGYKRTSKGFQIVDKESSVPTAGDEPYLLYQKFSCNPNVVVAVCTNKNEGMTKIIAYRPDVDVVILDDAFQCRQIIPNLNILLTPFEQLFFNDHLFPLGRLREPRKGVKRADMMVITKSPADLANTQMMRLKTTIQANYAPLLPIFFSYVIYHQPIAIGIAGAQEPLPYCLVLFTGIAYPLPLRNYLTSQGHQVIHLTFPDHHWFTHKDILKVIDHFHACKNPSKAIVTTEKDYVRLINRSWTKELTTLPIFYIPIETTFKNDQNTFEEKIIAMVSS